VKSTLRTVVAGFALAGALAVPGIAFAAASSADTGGYCVKSANGCDTAFAHGKGGDVPNYAGGADGYQTGINKSSRTRAIPLLSALSGIPGPRSLCPRPVAAA
jgi:hypothetical protein